METGSRATFVISWSQTEIDGTWSAPLDALRTGASWSWTGEVVRVDGPAVAEPEEAGPSEAGGLVELRARAARSVRKLLKAVATDSPRLDRIEVEAPLFERGFTVTDGRRTWTVTIIGTGPGKPPLAMFLGDPPPRHCDLWVVSHAVDLTAAESLPDAPGGVICFTPGTLISCAGGARPVESLTEGDRIQTKDNGLQPVLWIGRRRVSGARLYALPHLAPVRLRAGALDDGVPDAGLLVSPDHRIVLGGARARLLFNCDEVLVAARDLVDGRSVTVDRTLREVTYLHLLLPHHEIVFANAVETESFHPASAALATMDPGQRDELLRRLPDGSGDPRVFGAHARRSLSPTEAAILRHDAA